MKRNEVGKLLDLLERLYQGKRRPRDEVTAAIWVEVLKPWDYEQVRDAAILRARESRYFPDPSELAEYLPKAAGRAPVQDRRKPPGAVELAHMERARQWERAWNEELRARGLPTLHEASLTGLSPGAWAQLLREAGVWRAEDQSLAKRLVKCGKEVEG